MLESSHACHLRFYLVFQGDLLAPFKACSHGATYSLQNHTEWSPTEEITSSEVEYKKGGGVRERKHNIRDRVLEEDRH